VTRRSLPREVAFWLVALAFLTTMLGTTLPTPLYVLYQQKLRFSALMITVIFAVYAAGVLAALVLFGRASDELGRRRLLLAGLGCSALSAVAFLLAHGLALLFVGRVLSGLSAGIFTGTATAGLVDLAGGRGAERRATLVATACSMLGLGLGPLLAGALAQLAPLPLRLPFWIDLGLVLIATIALWPMPETVDVPKNPRLRVARPDVPRQVRATFIPAAIAAFAGFAVLGLFTSVAPSFLGKLLHDRSHLLSGAVVFAVFAASALGQVALTGPFGRWALPAGCGGLVVGMALLAGGLGAKSLALLVAAAVVAGLAQGLSFRSGLQAVNEKAPSERRGGVASSFFIVAYLAISLPVVGEGVAAEGLGLQSAGILFAVAVAVVAAVALASVISRTRSLRHVAYAAIAALALVLADGAAHPRDAHARSAAAASPVLAATPYMGWNTYYQVGGVFNQQTIVSVAQSLLKQGLVRAGYRIVWMDFGWASGKRASDGSLVLNPGQWPNGLPWLTAWLHRHGMLAGIYTDAGASGCYHRGVGSLHHYQQDANTFAAWGFDAVKVDFCGAGQEGFRPRPLYRQFAKALRNTSSRRPMILNVCNFWVPGQIDGKHPSYADSSYANALWASAVAQSWRTDTDIGGTGSILFKNVLRNLDHDAAHPKSAGPGHWNDPDYLGPQLGMTSAEARAQLTMWAIVAAPLILGSDPRKLSAATIRMLSNRRVIAIDQDRLGVQGTAISHHGSGQVWVKPLAGGDRAVALLNRGTSPLRITTTTTAIKIRRARKYKLENLWTGTQTVTTGTISVRVPADATVLYRVSPA